MSGTDTDESDLDLLVDPAESTSLLTIAGLKIDAEELLGVPVCVCVNSEWIAAEISQPGVATGPTSMKHPERRVPHPFATPLTKGWEQGTTSRVPRHIMMMDGEFRGSDTRLDYPTQPKEGWVGHPATRV